MKLNWNPLTKIYFILAQGCRKIRSAKFLKEIRYHFAEVKSNYELFNS